MIFQYPLGWTSHTTAPARNHRQIASRENSHNPLNRDAWSIRNWLSKLAGIDHGTTFAMCVMARLVFWIEWRTDDAVCYRRSRLDTPAASTRSAIKRRLIVCRDETAARFNWLEEPTGRGLHRGRHAHLPRGAIAIRAKALVVPAHILRVA